MSTVRCSIVALVAAAGFAAAIAVAQPGSDKPKTPGSAPAHGMPGGSDAAMEEMMQACMEAGTPGEMHEHLARAVGTWQGKVKMWHTPEGPAMESTCTTTITPLFGGRFVKAETSGMMEGMGEFAGLGINGFDNVSQEFQSFWIDNMGTGMGRGTGELSADGKTMTWTLTYNCPVTKKPATLRQIERVTGPDAMTLEMHGTNPMSGKEFKMMEIAYTRTSVPMKKM